MFYSKFFSLGLGGENLTVTKGQEDGKRTDGRGRDGGFKCNCANSVIMYKQGCETCILVYSASQVVEINCGKTVKANPMCTLLNFLKNNF